MAEKPPLDRNTVRKLLSAYIKYGPSGLWRVDPSGKVDFPTDGNKNANDVLPTELKQILEDILHESDNIPPEWVDLIKEHDQAQREIRDRLTPDQKAAYDAFWDKLRNASKAELEQLENSVQDMDPAVRDAVRDIRRERQSFSSKALKEWNEANPQEDESDDSDDSKDPQDGDNEKDGDSDSFDEQDMDPKEDGEDDGEDEGDGDGDGSDDDGSGDDSGDDDGDNDSDDGDGQGDKGDPKDGDGKQKGKGKPQDGDGDGNGEPQDGSSDGKPQDGKSDKNKGKGKPGQFEEDQSREDTEPGHEEWLKRLEEEAKKQEQQNQEKDDKDADAKDEAEGDGDGEEEDRSKTKGKDKPSDKPRPQHPEGVFNLSDLEPDKGDVEAAKQALARLISRGRNNPTRLPRWKMNDLMKRLLTFRNPKPAKKPTLERKAVVFIIDNSPSMAHLEAQSRALAGALSASGGPAGADVIVCLSSNGEYSARNEPTPRNQDGAWFRNGKLMGLLPQPAEGLGVPQGDHARCWEWFIRKYLPSTGVEVQLIGFYGDNDGTRQWNYISHAAKGIRSLWFNPLDKGRGPVEEVYNPDLSNNGMGSAPGYVRGDKRYETFKGRYFIRVDTVRDIADVLRKVAGL